MTDRRAAALTAARAFLRFGLPAAGIALIGRAGLLSIGGDIERWQFVAGLILVAAGFANRLVPDR